ncbi:MAG: two-component system sensor histidine kinase NtrB [Thermoanaerobaculum sp.]
MARWLLGLRLLAIGAVVVTALILQSLSEEILPLSPLFAVAGWGFALSLVWLILWLAGLEPAAHGLLQLLGDVVLVTAIVYFTGGAWSPFAFLLLAPVLLAALMYGLKGALALASAAFLAYLAMVQLVVSRVLPPPASISALASPRPPSLTLQLGLTAVGFASVALLASYLAHSLQQAEQSLQEEREAAARALALTADVLRSVESGVLACDLKGRVLLANPAASSIIGQPAPLEGKSLPEVLPLAAVEWETILDRVAKGFPQRLEGELPPSHRPVGCTVTPLSSDHGAVLGAVVHFRDLTEVQEAAQKEKLKERMVAAGEMAAGIAHEIRNPLNALSIQLDLVAEETGTDPAAAETVALAKKEVSRLRKLVTDFLQYARPSPPQKEPVEVEAFLQDVAALLGPECERAGVSLVVEASAGTVMVDRGQMTQVLLNLGLNALQALAEAELRQITLRAFRNGSHWVLAVEDSGKGIPPEELPRVKEAFYSNRKGGTGLGLAIADRIVVAHGGQLVLENRPQGGLSAEVRLPVSAEGVYTLFGGKA